jgi:hypothetical protein
MENENGIDLKTIVLKFLSTEIDNLTYGAIGIGIACILKFVPDMPESAQTLLIGAAGVCVGKFKPDK